MQFVHMPGSTWFLLGCLAFGILSCQPGEKRLQRELDRARSPEMDPYAKVYAYAAYLSTAKEVAPEEAIGMINEMIASGYPMEARYSINNLMDRGISSYDLLALRGLCYLHEAHPELARRDLQEALQGDPGNRKIELLLDQAEGGTNREWMLQRMWDTSMERFSAGDVPAADSILSTILETDPLYHRALFSKGLIRIRTAAYDSAFYYLSFAGSIEESEEYGRYIALTGRLLEGDSLTRSNPDSFRGYLIQSEALAGMGFHEQAHRVLDEGLGHQPDHLNLILAKALVWVQSGETETARQYLREQQERGIAIDPRVVNQILQPTQ